MNDLAETMTRPSREVRTRILALFACSLALSLATTGCEACDAILNPDLPDQSGPPAYALGLVPAGLGVRWPARPRIEEEMEVASDAELDAAWTASNARVRIRGQLDQLVIDADDVEVVVDSEVFIGSLVVTPGHRRIHVHGGTFGQLVLEGPSRLLPPPPRWRAVDMTEDVLIEDVTVSAIRSGLSGVLLRGRRVALVNSRVDAQFYAVFVGDTAPVPSEDIVVAGCSLYSEGEDPTVALSDVRRGVIVDTWMENPRLSALRFHGESEWLVASRNTLVGGGVMIGTDPRDQLSNVWFWVNDVHHSTPDLLSLEPDRIRELVLANNLFYTDAVSCAWCGRTPESWLVQNNRVRGYRSPPARP